MNKTEKKVKKKVEQSAQSIGFILFMVIVDAIFIFQSLKLPLGTMRSPGAGFIPLVASSIVMVLLIVLLANEFDLNLKHYDWSVKPETQKSMIRLGLFLLGCIGYSIIFMKVSVSLANFVALVYLMRVCGVKSWRTTLLCSLATAVILYLVFQMFLDVTFPKGLLRF